MKYFLPIKINKTSFLSLILIFSIALSFISKESKAQLPQFFNNNTATPNNVFPWAQTPGKGIQTYIAPNQLTGAFNGNIVKLYWKVTPNVTCTYTDLTIKLGQTTNTGLDVGAMTTSVPFTTVYYAASATLTSNVDGWVSVVIPTPYLYNPLQALVVDVFNCAATNSSMQTCNYAAGGPGPTRTYSNNSGSCTQIYQGQDNITAGFGVDMVPNTPCSGMPNAGIVSPATATVCAGQSMNLSVSGVTLAANLLYQWEESINGGATWQNATGGIGATTQFYTTPIMTSNIMYRFRVICTNTNDTAYSTPVTYTVASPTYATLPYSQDFELWNNYCGNFDVPVDGSGLHWTTNPLTGDNAWRRQDQGASAIWTAPYTNGLYTPQASSGTYSARFHSYNTTLNGDMNLYVNCNTALIGDKTLFFDFINNTSAGGSDYIEIQMSTNGGATFIPLGSFLGTPVWTNYAMVIPSNSANTVIKFKGYGGNNFVAGSDMGVDNVQVFDGCTGTPTAGIISNATPCPNQMFNLIITGSTLAGNMDFEWQSAPTAAGPWLTIGNSANPQFSTSIAVSTYFRCNVTCLTSNITVTTPVQLINVGSFWICYCNSTSTSPTGQNVGNVKLVKGTTTLLDNGVPQPIVLLNNPTFPNNYSTFAFTLAPVNIYRDSTYDFSLTGISFNGTYALSYAKMYIDYNRDGFFDPFLEEVIAGNVSAPSQILNGTFTVPNNANYGITGMRVIYAQGGTALTINPCGSYVNGETEDYLVDIKPAPCLIPPNAGIASISDTAICPGYSIFLSDTSHDKNLADLTNNWQSSTDGINFTDMAGTSNVDTMTLIVTANTWYRYKTTCSLTAVTYSNVVRVQMNPPISCYPPSGANGGSLDSSDIGAFVISDPVTNTNLYSFITGGPHLSNPLAVKPRTDYTSLGAIDLFAATEYRLGIFHILKGNTHKDAKVTVFIDYNNNQVYDIPNERIFSDINSSTNFYLSDVFTTPQVLALNVATGMRVVLNEDLAPSAASDNGVGLYLSGETEDYLVKFKIKPVGPSAVEEFNSLKDIELYPNPTSGLVYIGFNAIENTTLNISLVSLTGAKLYSKDLGVVNGQKIEELDLSNFSKGVYMLKFTTDKGNFVRKITLE